MLVKKKKRTSLEGATEKVIKNFVWKVKRLGYKSDRTRSGVDLVALGAEFGVGYHAVRLWLNGQNPIPHYAAKFIERQWSMKNIIP